MGCGHQGQSRAGQISAGDELATSLDPRRDGHVLGCPGCPMLGAEAKEVGLRD